MVNYVISKNKTFSYLPIDDIITIGDHCFINFTESEVTEFISDCLTHEHIHRVLNKLFDGTTSILFDGIEYLFRNDELHKTHLKGTSRYTYQSYIKRKGFDEFLDYYGLDDYDVLGANILCNSRKKTMLQHGGL